MKKTLMLFFAISMPFMVASLYAGELPESLQPVISQPSDHLSQIILSLVVVLLFIFLAAFLLKRSTAFPGVASGNIRILGGINVGQREKVVLLQAGKEQIVIGVTASEITFLHELRENVEVEESKPLLQSNFALKLQEAISKRAQRKDSKNADSESVNRGRADND